MFLDRTGHRTKEYGLTKKLNKSCLFAIVIVFKFRKGLTTDEA